jgi:hypothetical protein
MSAATSQHAHLKSDDVYGIDGKGRDCAIVKNGKAILIPFPCLDMAPATLRDEMAAIALTRNVHAELVNALLIALPFIEDAEIDPGYKPGVVKKHLGTIHAALKNAGVKK